MLVRRRRPRHAPPSTARLNQDLAKHLGVVDLFPLTDWARSRSLTNLAGSVGMEYEMMSGLRYYYPTDVGMVSAFTGGGFIETYANTARFSVDHTIAIRFFRYGDGGVFPRLVVANDAGGMGTIGWHLLDTQDTGRDTYSYSDGRWGAHTPPIGTWEIPRMQPLNGVWHDMVITYRGNTVYSEVPRMYANGIEQSVTIEVAPDSGQSWNSASEPLMWIGNANNATRGWFGFIRDVLMANRIWTPEEVYRWSDPRTANDLYWVPRRRTYTFFVPGAEAQFAYPASDVSDGSWTASTGSDLYAMVDEPTTASDVDFIFSSEEPVNDIAILQLGSVDTPDAGTVTLRFVRGKKCHSFIRRPSR